jgi:hypothetical protein
MARTGDERTFSSHKNGDPKAAVVSEIIRVVAKV